MMWTLPEEERALINKAPFNEEEYKNEIDVKELWGEKGFTTYERTGIRPTLELNGIWGGYQAKAPKPYRKSKRQDFGTSCTQPEQRKDDKAVVGLFQ